MNAEATAQAWLSADTVFEGAGWSALGTPSDLVALVSDAVAAFWREVSRPSSDVMLATVVFETDAALRTLNKQFRGIDKPTNVLSFPAPPLPPDIPLDERGPRHIGDIVFALETVQREAADLGIPPAHHLQHLIVHGLLHLLGYDHVNDREAERMECLETKILAQLGVPDPYADSDPLPP